MENTDADFPLRVRNAWGADLFNIPNTKVVMHVKPVDKFKAIKRIDKCIGEMETRQILSERASETNSAETHRESLTTLLDSLQTDKTFFCVGKFAFGFVRFVKIFRNYKT